MSQAPRSLTQLKQGCSCVCAWPARTAASLAVCAVAYSTLTAPPGGQASPASSAFAAAWRLQSSLLTPTQNGDRLPPPERWQNGRPAQDADYGFAASCGIVSVAGAILFLRAQARAATAARRHARSGLQRPRTTRYAAVNEGEGEVTTDADAALSEAEKMFKEAYEAEAERVQLLERQLEAALSAKLQADGEGDAGVRIKVESSSKPLTPETGGQITWQEAYTTAKARAASLEEQLKKATSMGSSGTPPPPASAATATPVESSESAPKPQTEESKGPSFGPSPFEFMDADKRDPEGFQKLEDLAQTTIEDEAMLRLIAVPILGRRATSGDLTARLPSATKVREIMGSDQFSVSDSIEFGRVTVLKGVLAGGVNPGAALETLRERLAQQGYGETAELFLQRSKEEGRNVLFVMLKEDLPKNEFAWWQWLLCIAVFLGTLASVNVTTFSVVTADQLKNSPTMDLDTVSKLASKTIPTAVSILGTIAAQEVARRLAAAKYKVDLTPPFFIPVWPFPSTGSFGAVTRRLGTVPNDEASVAMSAAAGLAGFVVSTLILCYGLVLGPDPDKVLNLNFQLLPLVLKLVLKPLLGVSSVTDQPDPFADPISIAFSANPWTIGGIIGLIVTSLNMLPIGRLDGGNIAKGILGGRNGGFLSFGALFLLLLSTIAPSDAGTLYLTFGSFCIIFQGGSESPPRDGVTEVDGSLKFLGLFLIAAGTLLSLPGILLPNV